MAVNTTEGIKWYKPTWTGCNNMLFAGNCRFYATFIYFLSQTYTYRKPSANSSLGKKSGVLLWGFGILAPIESFYRAKVLLEQLDSFLEAIHTWADRDSIQMMVTGCLQWSVLNQLGFNPSTFPIMHWHISADWATWQEKPSSHWIIRWALFDLAAEQMCPECDTGLRWGDPGYTIRVKVWFSKVTNWAAAYTPRPIRSL